MALNNEGKVSEGINVRYTNSWTIDPNTKIELRGGGGGSGGGGRHGSILVDGKWIPHDEYYKQRSFAEKKISYKYNEGVYIKEITDYINSTYSEHYSRNKFQATEFIMDSGHGTGFCMGNVLKYAQRYGRKGSREDWRKDLLKVIHYAMMQLYVHDIVNKETI